MIERADDLHRAGRLGEAETLYEQILQAHPGHIDALHLLGLIALERVDYLQAAQRFQELIALDDSQALAHYHLGLVRSRQGMLEEAAGWFEKAQTKDATFAPAHNNLGAVRLSQRRPAEAEACFRRALALDPNFAEAHFNLGLALRLSDDPHGAAQCFRNALAIHPSYVDALMNLGDVLLSLGQPSESAACFQKALEIVPANATGHCCLGDALCALGEPTQAIAAYQRAASLDDAYLQPWWRTGCVQAALGEFASAADSFRRALEIAPDYGDAYNSLGMALFESGTIDEALDALHTAAVLMHHDPEPPMGSIATIIPGSPRTDDGAIRTSRQAWAESVGIKDPPGRSVPLSPAIPGRRLRIGYVSAYFQERNWMKPVFGLIHQHNRDRFEIHLLSDAPESRIRYGYRRHPQDRFHDISGLSNQAAASLIESQKIDILVDLNGYSRRERLPLIGLRPAPIQIAWFNMYATSGLRCFDFLIGDDTVILPHEEESYSERIIRVQGCYLTFEVNYPTPDVQPAPSLSSGTITFGCLAPQYKITVEMVEAWSRILHASPDSRLLLKNHFLNSAKNREFAHSLFGRFGIASERIILDGPAEHYHFLARYGDVDVALDSFPYNGGTTTMEALWQGVPVLTYYGDRWASRISASILRNAGLPDFIAPDLDGYIRRAIELANDAGSPAKIDDLRQTMRARLLQAPVCDTRRFAQDMERQYLSVAGMNPA